MLRMVGRLDPDRDKQHDPEFRGLRDNEDEAALRQRVLSINITRVVHRGYVKPPALLRSSVGRSSVGMDTCKVETSDNAEAV